MANWIIPAADIIWSGPFPLIARGFCPEYRVLGVLEPEGIPGPLVHVVGACLEVEEQQHR